MTQYTLHKLPEGFIITSDEEIKEGDEFIDLRDKENLYEEDIYTAGLGGSTEFANKIGQKVITQQDQIDFSFLSEEEQIEIGWYDWLRIAIISEGDEMEKIGEEYHSNSWYKGVEFGFQKAQELLSDRRFTLEIEKLKSNLKRDLRESVSTVNKQMFEGALWGLEKLSQSLSQPKSWKVKIEMENKIAEYEPKGCDFPDYIQVPKLTNGKIKILKLI